MCISITFVYCRILNYVLEKFQPEAVVCQCGADGLVNDPMDSFNLTSDAYIQCIKFLVKWELPLLLLGGGCICLIEHKIEVFLTPK